VSHRTETFYRYLVGKESAGKLDDGDASRVATSFLTILLAQFCTKLGDALASTKVILPAFMASLGVPAFFTGLIVPIRESGSMLPQLVLGQWVKRFALRKWSFVLGALLQAMSVFGIASVAWLASGFEAGVAIIILLVCFSLSRSLCSLSSKDVLGKTIPKRQRGTLMGYSASLAGLITLAVAALVYLGGGNAEAYLNAMLPSNGGVGASLGEGGAMTLLLLVSASLFLIGGLTYAAIPEKAGSTQRSDSSNKQSVWSGLALFRNDVRFRRFVTVRALMMSSSLAAPYFILAAMQGHAGKQLAGVGLFIGAEGLAGLLSGRLWGGWADRNSKMVLAVTAFLTALLCALAIGLLGSDHAENLTLWFLLFLALSLVHHGVRLGRKTYVVDMAEGDQRTDYVAVSNTAIGALLLLFGGLAAILANHDLSWALLVFAGSSALAVWLNRTLPDLSQADGR